MLINLGNDDGTKIDSSKPLVTLERTNRVIKISNFCANLTAQIYQHSLGGVWSVLSFLPFVL